MREMKFRVWCKDRNEWEKDFCTIGQDGCLFHHGKGGQMATHQDNHIVMFYSGLKDIRNREEYELDIVKAIYNNDNGFKDKSFEEIGVVEFQRGAFVFVPMEDYKAKERLIVPGTLNYMMGSGNYTFEILGNIYQNPELIK